MKFKLFYKQYMIVCIVSYAAIQSIIAIVPVMHNAVHEARYFFLRLLSLCVYIYIAL